ncbi:MAG: DNA polymerase III subunit delta [Bacteroidales bacterium]|nr:DNA polymerase III subunit delta [Bacteroidales bacterium]
MQFKDIEGNENVKKLLIRSVKENRISHGQLFLGPPGCGKLAFAIAYAQYISCKNRTETDSCGVCPSCVKFQKLIHPDLHFVYPVVTSTAYKKPVSDDYIAQWRQFVLQRNYHGLDLWYDFIGSENAQGAIFAQESQEIIKKLNLKTFEGEYKVMIIWMAEKMNETAANKLLKMLEEPPAKTLFVLVAENEEQILTTIRSRVQLIKFSALTTEETERGLLKEFPSSDLGKIKDSAILCAGDYLEAVSILSQLENGGGDPDFELFTTLMRESFSSHYDKIIKLSDDLTKLGREKQKRFFDYCQRMVRECFLMSSVSRELVRMTPAEMSFAEKFSPFIHHGNIAALTELLSEAARNIERNAYGKLVFTDLAIKISAQLHVKKP